VRTTGDIVTIDTLPAHQVAGSRQIIEERASPTPFRPPYSPAFNPIELVFANLKALIRKTTPRSITKL
jgi:transposase